MVPLEVWEAAASEVGRAEHLGGRLRVGSKRRPVELTVVYTDARVLSAHFLGIFCIADRD